MANVAAPNEALQTLLAVRVVRKVEAYILLDSTLRKASEFLPREAGTGLGCNVGQGVVVIKQQ